MTFTYYFLSYPEEIQLFQYEQSKAERQLIEYQICFSYSHSYEFCPENDDKYE